MKKDKLGKKQYLSQAKSCRVEKENLNINIFRRETNIQEKIKKVKMLVVAR